MRNTLTSNSFSFRDFTYFLTSRGSTFTSVGISSGTSAGSGIVESITIFEVEYEDEEEEEEGVWRIEELMVNEFCNLLPCWQRRSAFRTHKFISALSALVPVEINIWTHRLDLFNC